MNELILAVGFRWQSGTSAAVIALLGFLGLALVAGFSYSRPLAARGRFARTGPER